jgi:hypothetical protein
MAADVQVERLLIVSATMLKGMSAATLNMKMVTPKGEAINSPDQTNRFSAGAALWEILCPPACCAGSNARQNE